MDGFVVAVNWDEIRGLNLEGLRARGLQEDEKPLAEPRPVTPVRQLPNFDLLAPSRALKYGTGKLGQKGGLFILAKDDNFLSCFVRSFPTIPFKTVPIKAAKRDGSNEAGDTLANKEKEENGEFGSVTIETSEGAGERGDGIPGCIGAEYCGGLCAWV